MSTSKAPVKRKSTLSELGIKPGGAETSAKPTTKTTSVTKSGPSSPSVSKTRSVTSSTKTPLTSIKTERPPGNNSPTSPSPRRRSIVPTNSNQRATMSPLARRASINVTQSASSKRVSSPTVGLASLEEVQSVKDELNEKDQEVQRLRKINSESQDKINTLQVELEKLREEFKLSLENSKQNAIIENNEENKMQETEKKHQLEMEKLLEQQEKKLEAELATLRIDISAEYDIKIKHIQSEHENQVQHWTSKHNDQIQKLQKDHNSIISGLKEQIQSLQDALATSHLRKVENELDSTLAALEELKRTSQQEREALERRYRNEIKQLQTGNDDTTEVWLEKTRSAQQEVNKLHDQIQIKDKDHAKAIQAIKDAHGLEVQQLQKLCEEKEHQIEDQSNQIENLVQRVEALQNSLEAATIRFENTAKSTPNTSSTTNTTTAVNKQTVKPSNIEHDHQECLDRVDAKQKEIDQLQAHISELKEVHEAQLKRLAQEKATTLQELNKKLQLPVQQNTSEDRLIRIAEQHRNEIRKMHVQYQVVVDAKNRELEDYAYRVKAIVAAKQKEMEDLEMSNKRTIETLKKRVDDLEKESFKLKERAAHWEMLSNNNETLIQDMKKECLAHKDENAQLSSLVSQLQSEIHH